MLRKRHYWFLVIEVIIYSSFLYLDFYSKEYAISNRLKFAGIFLCFFTAFLSMVLYRDRKTEIEKQDHFLLFAAFCFTLGADILLLFTDAYWQGVVCFIVVQSIYFYRICILVFECRKRTGYGNKEKSKSKGKGMRRNIRKSENSNGLKAQGIDREWILSFYRRHLLIRMCIGVLFNLVFYICKIWDPVTCCSSFYLISFVGNLYWMFMTFLEDRERRKQSWFLRFFWGMVLFFFCDISVGVYNLADYLPFLTRDVIKYLQYAGNLMWLFYLPGQVLLSISGRTNKKRT